MSLVGQRFVGGAVSREALVWVAAAVANAFALLMIAAPSQFAAAAYDAVRPDLLFLGAAFAASGVLLLAAALGALPRLPTALAIALGAAPFARLALAFVATGTGAITYGVFAVTLLVIAVETAAGRRLAVHPLLTFVGAAQIATGLLILVRPEIVSSSAIAHLGPWLPALAVSYLVAGSGLMLSDVRRLARARVVFSFVAAASYIPIFNAALGAGTWTGMVVYGALITALAVTALGAGRAAWVVLGLGLVVLVSIDDLRAAFTAAPDASRWMRMRPEVAVGVLVLTAALALQARGRQAALRRQLFLASGLFGLALVALSSVPPSTDPFVMVGRDAATFPLPSSGIAIALLGFGGFFGGMRDRAWSPHLVAGIATIVVTIGLANLFAYVVDVPFLVASYGLLAMRIHLAMVFVSLGALLATSVVPAILRGPIAGRVFGGMGLIFLALVVLALYWGSAGAGLLHLLETDPQAVGHFAVGAVAVSQALMLLFMVAVVVLAVLFTRTVTRPLDALAGAMGRFADGDREVRAVAEGNDEVANAIRAFNHTADRLVRSESAVLQLNMELERRVYERTAELAAATQELEAFAYTVSHDLRAPLRAIDGFATVLLEEDGERLSHTGRRYLDKVRGATAEMSSVIDDLLRLSIVSRAEMHRERVDLSALARELIERIGDERTQWVVTEGVEVDADPGLLRTALDNLLSNAFKFTRRVERARIEVGRVAETGEVFVRDNGVGFDMAYVDRLFQPFQRLHSKAEYDGTGIGLATVQRVVTRHGGHARAEAAPGAGATFYLAFGGS